MQLRLTFRSILIELKKKKKRKMKIIIKSFLSLYLYLFVFFYNLSHLMLLIFQLVRKVINNYYGTYRSRSFKIIRFQQILIINKGY